MIYEKLTESAKYINNRLKDSKHLPEGFVPKIVIVLGSGLGELAEEVEGISIDYSEIPGFKKSGVESHKGRLFLGFLASKPVAVLQGRIHYYEGNSFAEVVFPVRTMSVLGAKTLIATNAAGCINKNFSSGSLMLILDHINLMGKNPLVGENISQLGERFPDMTNAYNPDLIRLSKQEAQELKIRIESGVYAGMSGPSYETPAEIKMLRVLGADAVGMSTVPEVIAARHAGMSVLGISCLTNMAAGIIEKPLSHSEVLDTALIVKNDFKRLVKAVVKDI